MLLTNVSSEQLQALQSNFENQLVIKPSEEKGKYDVTFMLDFEKDAWKLFFSGADWAKSLINIKP